MTAIFQSACQLTRDINVADVTHPNQLTFGKPEIDIAVTAVHD